MERGIPPNPKQLAPHAGLDGPARGSVRWCAPAIFGAVASFVLAVLAGCAATPLAPAPTTPPPPAQQSVKVGDTTILAVGPAPAPCCKKPTLPECLGLPQLRAGIGDLLRRLLSRIQQGLGIEGRFPGLQPQAPLLPITDPANLTENSPPAVKAAAEVKKEEEQAAQKVQALRYLATIGCGGCYPGIEEAFIAALDDCTEAVRYEAVVALRGNSCIHCRYCNQKSCCSARIQKKLEKIAYDTHDDGCFREPSGRVRRLARQVLECCGGYEEPAPRRPEEGPPDDSATARAGHRDSEVRPAAFEQPIRLPPTRSAREQGTETLDRETERAEGNDVIARVNGEAILRGSFATTTAGPTEPARNPALRPEVDRAIDAALLRQQMQRELGSSVPADAARVQAWLDRRLVFDTYVAPSEVAERYERTRERFRTTAGVRWERIRVPCGAFRTDDQARAAADALRQRALGAPGDRLDLRPGQVQSETIGWTSLDDAPAPVSHALRTLPVGGVSPVLEGRREFLLVRVLERRIGETVPLAAAAPVLQREILQERRQQSERAFLELLRRQSRIESFVTPHATQ